MGLENWTIQKILETEDGVEKVLSGRLHSGMFKGKAENKAFEFILEHQKDFGKSPDKVIVTLKSGISWDSGIPKEPLEFFIKEMHNRELYEALAEGQVGIVEALKAKDPQKARTLLVDLMNGTASSLNEEVRYREMYSPDALATRISKYEAIKALGSIDGIPTPWDALSETTYGWHEEDFILVAGRTGT